MSRPPARPDAPLLLFAQPLQREGLRRWLEQDTDLGPVSTGTDDLVGAPRLVIWSLTVPPPADALERELAGLVERWHPAPLLLLLPPGHPYPTPLLLRLPAEGLLEDPDATSLRDAVRTLLEGGRVVNLAGDGGAGGGEPAPPPGLPLGLGQWLLLSGLGQIDAELAVCGRLLEPPPEQLLPLLLLQGRQRELRTARRLLLWLWGPVSLAWPARGPDPDPEEAAPQSEADPAAGSVAITLRRRTADGIWEALRGRLRQAAAGGAANLSGQLLALDGLHPDRRSDLLVALLEQVDQLRRRLQQADCRNLQLAALWSELQVELRRQALRSLAGSYVQLPCEGELRPVAETLERGSELGGDDPELPDPLAMLGTLVQARPLLVDGRLMAPDEPQALLYLELLLSNWLVRTAELISAEILAACGEWPELRRYLLRPELLATRELERLRNQLNAQQRWNSWVARPIALYESRRPLYRLAAGGIQCVDLTEPRDRELRQLGWLQQLVTLALEARDALAPQLQTLVRKFGDLLVVLLTRVIGRAIGLVGRGIAQGMGRSLGRR